MGTMAPLYRTYLQGRLDRSEINQRTAEQYGYVLDALDVYFGKRPLTQWGPGHADKFMATVVHLRPTSKRHYLTQLKAFSTWLYQTQEDVSQNAAAHIKPIRQPRSVPVTLKQDEVAALLKVAPGLRGRAIIWLMVGCGCRCVEVARLKVEDYDRRARIIRLDGKYHNERVIPVPEEAAVALDAYLDARGNAAGPFIVNQRTGGHLTPKSVSIYVTKYSRAAGVKVSANDGRGAHGLRRTAASDVYDQCGDITVVQEMLGHKEGATTLKHYLRPVSMTRMREAMQGRNYAQVTVERQGLPDGPEGDMAA